MGRATLLQVKKYSEIEKLAVKYYVRTHFAEEVRKSGQVGVGFSGPLACEAGVYMDAAVCWRCRDFCSYALPFVGFSSQYCIDGPLYSLIQIRSILHCSPLSSFFFLRSSYRSGLIQPHFRSSFHVLPSHLLFLFARPLHHAVAALPGFRKGPLSRILQLGSCHSLVSHAILAAGPSTQTIAIYDNNVPVTKALAYALSPAALGPHAHASRLADSCSTPIYAHGPIVTETALLFARTPEVLRPLRQARLEAECARGGRLERPRPFAWRLPHAAPALTTRFPLFYRTHRVPASTINKWAGVAELPLSILVYGASPFASPSLAPPPHQLAISAIVPSHIRLVQMSEASGVFYHAWKHARIVKSR